MAAADDRSFIILSMMVNAPHWSLSYEPNPRPECGVPR